MENEKQGGKKSSRGSMQKGKRVSKGSGGKRYPLRSSKDGVRVLRSISNGKGKSPTEPVKVSVQQATTGARRRKTRKAKKTSNDEFLTIQKRVRYLLSRMNYEQNFIDAYACEGWKGQSLEKIRPEKELQRAKAEILRCKLRIRETFQHIDSLFLEGKLEESLFDSEGEICSEDIFCAKCSAMGSSVDNDIILCDGICDRGFHQKCLNPPLLTENIPPGDEGWLCPACDCKVDCLDLLNESQGSDLSIEDSWEKVFPEAAATANGSKLCDESNLPSDDSEGDYDPDVSEGHTEDEEEESSAEESDFTASSEDLSSLNQKKQQDDFGYPSDDSEDDDFDPEAPDPDKDSKKGQSSSNESDFTSDSDDFCAELVKASGTGEASSGPGEGSTPSLLDTAPMGHADEENTTNTLREATTCQLAMEADPSLGRISPVLGRRQRERLDYKKLYDEAYGKESSDSSEDEDWSDRSTRKKGKKGGCGTESAGSPRLMEHHKSSARAKAEPKKHDSGNKLSFDPLQVSQAAQDTPKSRSTALHASVAEHSDAKETNSNGDGSTAQKRHFGPIITQKLHEIFKSEQYPSRTLKESLAQELGLTFRQVSKWFESTRHMVKHTNFSAGKNDGSSAETRREVKNENDGSSSRTRKVKNDGSSTKTRRKVEFNGKLPEEAIAPKAAVIEHEGGSRDGPNDNPQHSRDLVDDGSRKKAILRELRRRRLSR